MVNKVNISTDKAPQPIGAYSQAVQVGNLVFISGQIAINPENDQLEIDTIDQEVIRVFNNLKAISEAAGSNINNIVKLNLYLTNLANFGIVNEIMSKFFAEPYPARAAVQVSALPKNVNFEAEAVLMV